MWLFVHAMDPFSGIQQMHMGRGLIITVLGQPVLQYLTCTHISCIWRQILCTAVTAELQDFLHAVG